MTVARENVPTLGKDRPSAILPNIYPTWTALTLNPSLCSDKPWTKCLRYGMADLWQQNTSPVTAIMKGTPCL